MNMIPVAHAQLGVGEPATISQLEDVFSSLLSAVIPLAGIVLFIMLIIAGFQYITSAGDPKKAGAATNTLTFAVLGLVLVALAYLIIVVIAEFTGVDGILEFQVFRPDL